MESKYTKNKQKKNYIKKWDLVLFFSDTRDILLAIISELNYGEVSLSIIKFSFPNISMQAARKNTDKFMKALTEKDYEVLENIVNLVLG